MEAHKYLTDAKHMPTDVQDVGKKTSLRKYTDANVGRLPKMTKDTEQFMTHIKTQRW